MSNTQIAVTGSIAWDHIMVFPDRFKSHILADKLHILNVSFLVDEFRRERGGCAANIAYACALQGLSPNLIGAVGPDFAPYREWLESQGVDVRGVSVFEDVLTASCFITTDLDNNQITCFYPGAMARAKESGLGPAANGSALVTISPNDPDAMRAYPKECRAQGHPFLYDPGQNVLALSGDDFADGLIDAKALVCNDYELAIVQEKTKRTIPQLLELCETVVVTLGAEGSRVHLRDGTEISVPAAPVEAVVDPTGCGDAYRGGLVKGMVTGTGWEVAAQLGTLTAAYCVETQGTTNYSFTLDEFSARFADAFAGAS